MPSLLKYSEPPAGGRDPYEIDGMGTFWLPVLACPRCTPWNTSGLIYPTISPRTLPFALQNAGRKESGPLSVDEWQHLREVGREWAPEGVIIAPGTRFGPVGLKFTGKPLDFVWLGSFIPLVRKPVFEALARDGFDLRGVPANVKWSRGAPEPLIELEIRPLVRLAPKQRATPCPICGRLGQKAPKTVLLDEDSFDDSIALQRIFELPTYIVASDAIRTSIEKHGFSGVAFKRVQFS